jgi:hypothetical protein
VNPNLFPVAARFSGETATQPAYHLWSINDRQTAKIRVKTAGVNIAALSNRLRPNSQLSLCATIRIPAPPAFVVKTKTNQAKARPLFRDFGLVFLTDRAECLR